MVSQCRLSRTGYTRDYIQGLKHKSDINVFQVACSSSLDGDISGSGPSGQGYFELFETPEK